MGMKKRESQRDTSPCCELLKVIEESTGWAHASGPNNSQQGGFRTWTHQTPSEGAVHNMVENGEDRMSKNAGGIINQQRECRQEAAAAARAGFAKRRKFKAEQEARKEGRKRAIPTTKADKVGGSSGDFERIHSRLKSIAGAVSKIAAEVSNWRTCSCGEMEP